MLKFEAKMFFIMTFFLAINAIFVLFLVKLFDSLHWVLLFAIIITKNTKDFINETKGVRQWFKILSNYISSALKSLEIWAQVYEITNPITNFRVKNEKRLVKLYGWLAVLNIVFLMICAYNRFTFIFNNDILLIVLVLFFTLGFVYAITTYIAIGFGFALRCYTITGYKSIWLFIIGSFIPQIYCVVCSIIYFFS